MLRVIADVTEIRAQIAAAVLRPKEEGQDHTTKVTDDMDLDQQEPENKTDTTNTPTNLQDINTPAGDEQHPIQVFSQIQGPRETRKAQPKGKNKATRDDGTTKWKPEVIPDSESDAEALGLNGPKRWPPHPSVEDIIDNGQPSQPQPQPPQPTTRKDTKTPVQILEKLPIQPPLQNILRKYNQILGDLEDENPPDPSQYLIWNADGQNEDNSRQGHNNEAEEVPRGIGKDTQEDLDELDRITGRMEIRRQKLRKEEEERADKIKKELEDLVRRQKEGLEKEGAGI